MGDGRACSGVREWPSRKREVAGERENSSVTSEEVSGHCPKAWVTSSIPRGGKKWEVSIRRLLLYFLKEVCVKLSVECLHSW